MTTKQLREPTTFEITEAMMQHGGSFVKQLGRLFRLADDDNKQRLQSCFLEYFKKYSDICCQMRCPECASINIGRGYHDGTTCGVPECTYKVCEDCFHRWGME